MKATIKAKIDNHRHLGKCRDGNNFEYKRVKKEAKRVIYEVRSRLTRTRYDGRGNAYTDWYI